MPRTTTAAPCWVCVDPAPCLGDNIRAAELSRRCRLELRRWLHSLQFSHRDHAGNRGGASPALRRHDARQGPSLSDRAAALLRAATTRRRRSAYVCFSDAIYPYFNLRAFRKPRLADPGTRRRDGIKARTAAG